MVELVREDDGLPAFHSKGLWTARKLYFVCQYLEQVTRGMKSRRGFPAGLTYIDLFCGSGVSVVDIGTGPCRRFPGSPLIAAATPNAFDRLVVVDIDPARIEALKERITRIRFGGELVPLVGDSNRIIDQVISHVPQRSLNVAFIDP